jgi:hypothetical protein
MDAVVGEKVYALMFTVMKMAPAFVFYFSAVLHGAHTGKQQIPSLHQPKSK